MEALRSADETRNLQMKESEKLFSVMLLVAQYCLKIKYEACFSVPNLGNLESNEGKIKATYCICARIGTTFIPVRYENFILHFNLYVLRSGLNQCYFNLLVV